MRVSHLCLQSNLQSFKFNFQSFIITRIYTHIGQQGNGDVGNSREWQLEYCSTLEFWALCGLTPFIDSSLLSPCSIGEAVLWFNNVRAVRLSEHHHRCSESYCRKQASMVWHGCRGEEPHGTTPAIVSGRRESWLVRIKPGILSDKPKESEADVFTGWDRWVLMKPYNLGQREKRRKDTLPVCKCLFI